MTWRIAGFDRVALERGGWTFFIPAGDARISAPLRDSLIDSACAAIDGTGAERVRRSRHAETWFEHFDCAGARGVYIKVFDPIRGLNRIRRIFKPSRAAHVASISERLRADGVGVPNILLLGAERGNGREILVTARVGGRNVARFLRERAELGKKRVMLRALGAEVARLHRAGYIHGDLTPFNVFVTGLEPPQFVFIDHERTRRTILSGFERPRLRNLVQLGHLKLGGVTNTDRMRVWCGYAAALPLRRRRSQRRRVAALLATRMELDRKAAAMAARTSAPVREHREASGS